MLEKSSVDKARLLYYGLLSKFFVFRENMLDDIDDMLTIIISNPLNENVKSSAINLINTIDTKGTKFIIGEFEDLFHNPTNKPLNTSVSFYDEGIEFGKKCVQTKEILLKTNIRKDEKNYKDSEDSFGFLMVFMYKIIKNITNGKNEYKALQSTLFENIINPYIDLFIDDIFSHPESKNYKDVAIIASAFMEFERLYFEVKKPSLEKKTKKEYGISSAEAKRRAANKAKKQADKNKQERRNHAKTKA